MEKKDSFKLVPMIRERDILDSVGRLQEAFVGNYGAYPIEEDGRIVGRLTLDQSQKKIYITYRGSMASLFELFSCLFLWKTALEGERGRAHAGIYSAYRKTRPSFQSALESCLKQIKLPREQVEFVVEGYSRGSGLATLTALFLKQHFPKNQIDVLTYSTMKIFDDQGAESYQHQLGNRHFSFLCKEDFFHQWFGLDCLGYQPIGQPVYLFAERDGAQYRQRVANKAYSYMMQIPVITWIIQKIIPAAFWEAHMPQTYSELAPQAFTTQCS